MLYIYIFLCYGTHLLIYLLTHSINIQYTLQGPAAAAAAAAAAEAPDVR